LRLNGENLVITGGAGFIGKHTIKKILEEYSLCEKEKIWIVDNFHSGTLDNIDTSSKKVKIIEEDVRSFDEFFKKMKEIDSSGKIAGMIHLAAIISQSEAYKDPKLAVDTNVQGTLNALEITRRLNIERFVYSSSVAVFGEPKKLPIDELHPRRPINLYGLTKLMGEQLVQRFNEDYGIKTVSLRYFNVYGPGMRIGPYAGVIHNFITKILKREQPRIFGDGIQTRDFVYIEDIAEANIKSLLSKTTGSFNIGTGIETSINDLHKLLVDLIEPDNDKVFFEPSRDGDVKRSLANIGHSKERLKWHPKISLKDGLLETINWYENRRKNNLRI
jgi:UDP-glucose 4-epimerase